MLQEASDTDVEIVNSIDSAQSRRSSCSGTVDSTKAAGNHADQETSSETSDGAQLPTNSSMSDLDNTI